MNENKEIKGVVLLGSSSDVMMCFAMIGAAVTAVGATIGVYKLFNRGLRKQNKKLSKSIKEFCEYVKKLKNKES